MEQLSLSKKELSNPAFIEQIYRDYKEPVYNYIYRLSNDSSQAQDVVQQTFLKLMTDPGLGDVENIKSYLFTVARNYLYDTWKKKKETLVEDAGIDIAASADEEELTEELAAKQRQQAVIFCVQRLSDKFRELMILRYMQDLSIQEIASITQLNQSDIKVSLLRARQQFDRGLTQHMYLKVAKSRQQCTEMNSMLAPYRDVDIPDTELSSFEKHIDKCPICAEDAEELKRTRKLLALIPLATVPLSLDTSMNEAMATSGPPSTLAPDASATENAVMVKVAATIAIGALIVGSIMLLPEKQPDSVPSEPPDTSQSISSPPPQPTTQSQPPSKTAPDLVANVSEVRVSTQLTDTINLSDSQLSYIVYKSMEDMKAEKYVEVKEFRKPATTFKLAGGDYYLKALYRGFGNIEVVKSFSVKDGNPVDIDIPVEIGMFKPEVTLSNNNLSHIRNVNWAIRKSSVHESYPSGFVTINNGTETPMMPGIYILETKLEHITQLSEVTINAGQVNTHKIILKGGIVKFAGWLDNSKTSRNEDIYFYLYDYETYKRMGKQGEFIPRVAQINNDSNNSQILPEGKYTIVARNNIGHKVRLTQDFTVKDGDTKQIDVVVQK